MNKKFIHIFRVLTLAAVIGLASEADAVIAKPGVITAMQPDGSSVSIRLSGSEHSNRAYSIDGHLLAVDEAGYYVYASVDGEGEICASAFRADTPEGRQAATAAFLASLDPKEVEAAMDRMQTAASSLPTSRRAVAHPGLGRFNDSYPVFGDQRAVVLLVEFADNEFTSTDDPRGYFERMLNEEGFSDNSATGSARDYFLVNSMGVFRPRFDVYGPVKLENNMEYYGAHAAGANDRRPEKLITDACQLIDDQVDFSEYDCDGDGVIDNVYVFYAGMGEASGGGANTIWPHSAFLTDISKKKYRFDDLLLDRYACSNELEVNNATVGIGTFVHEFSHVLGLPDVYSTGYTEAFTPGPWSCIDRGNYNNDSRTPPYYSSFERYALGWLEPKVLEQPGQYSLDRIHLSNEAFIIPTDREEEYFLFENRQQEGLDTFIPGHGLLVWHIDFDEDQWLKNTVNNDAAHQHVDIVEADNILTERSRTGDAFPGDASIAAFTPSTAPALVSWNGVPAGFGLCDISESEDGIITFTLQIEEGGVRGISGEKQGLVSVSGNSVSLLDSSVVIYDCSGRKLNIDAHRPLILTSGIYIATLGSESHKFIIR